MPVLRTETVEGASKGIVTVRAPHELNDQEVVWLQDSLIDQAGLVRRRNGIPAAGGADRFNVVTDASNTRYPVGIASCFDPAGNARFAILYWDTTIVPGLYGAIYDSNMSFLGRQLLIYTTGIPVVGSVIGMLHVFTSQLPDGGCLISIAGSGNILMGPTDLTYNTVWYGGGGGGTTFTGTYGSPGTAISTLTVNRNDTLVTMAAGDVAKMQPGCVIGIFNQAGVGVVRKIESATTVSLVAPYVGANLAAVATGRVSATMNPLIYRAIGLVSASVTGNSLTGYGTKFKTLMDAVNSNTWTGVVISQLDGQVIATFSTGATTSDTNLGTVTVLRNATMEPHRILVTGTGSPVTWLPVPQPQGNITSFADFGNMAFVYKGHTFWLNKPNYNGANTFPTVKRDTPLTQRCWISGPTGPYDFDHEPAAGAYFDVVSEIEGDIDIMCGGATPNVAIICKRKSTYVVTGDSVDTFQITKLINEGALQGSKVLPYQGGVIWFGPSGIWFYDGTSSPQNLVKDTILRTYKDWVKSNPQNLAADGIATDHYAYYVKAFIHNDHLFFCAGGIGGNPPQVYSGHSATGQTSATMVMYLPNRAVNFWSNFRFIEYLPAEFNSARTGFVLLEQGGSAVWTMIALDTLMMPNYPAFITNLQNDNFQVRGCALSGLTPSFYMETKRYGLFDPMNKKIWKGISVEACFSDNVAHTSRVLVDYVAGLSMNQGGSILATFFPDTGSSLVFKAQRVKARARNQYLGYRIYEDPTRRTLFFMLGAWQLMFKPGRAGAI